MSRLVMFVYGVVCYGFFFVSFLYTIGFVGNRFVPKTIDSGSETHFVVAVFINLILVGLFAAQHTVMARPDFKKRWTRIIPKPAERSTFVLCASLLLILLLWQWRPIPMVIWRVDNVFGALILNGLFWLGWITVLLSSFMIDHFDLFGLRQVYLHLVGQKYRHGKFAKTGLYRYVRHPLMLGFITAFWATPRMTAGHLLLAAAFTVYILIGIRIEEHDLIRFLGREYKEYQRKVPMLFPFIGKR